MFKSSTVYARRVARIGFGVVLWCGAGLVLARLGMPHFLEPFERYTPAVAAPHVSVILGLTWGLALAVYGALYAATPRRVCAPRQLAAASMVVPGIGMALLVPLTLHLPMAWLFDGLGEGFDRWAFMSRNVAGPVHILFAALVALRGLQLARGDTALSPEWIFILVMIAAVIPWGALVLPPIIVALTGGPIVPALFRMATLMRGEREALGADLPHAVVRAR